MDGKIDRLKLIEHKIMLQDIENYKKHVSDSSCYFMLIRLRRLISTTNSRPTAGQRSTQRLRRIMAMV